MSLCRGPRAGCSAGRRAARGALVALIAFASVAMAGAGEPGAGEPGAGEPDDRWVGLAALEPARQEIGVAALAGKLYVIGGILANRSTTGRGARYDPASGGWEEIDPLPGGAQLHHVGAAALDGRVWAVGGLDASFRGVATLFAFDPSTGAWQRHADLLRARGAMGVAALSGRIYAAGGQTGGTSFRDLEAYDPIDDRWEPLPAMPTARNHLAAAALDGRFWAISGRAAGLRAELESYDPARGEWSSHAAIPTARGGLAAAVAAGKIFAFGGEGNSARADGIFPQVEAFDPSTGRWEPRPEMAIPRHGIGAAAIDGRIHIPGGAPIEGFATTSAHDAFVPRELARTGFLRGDANDDRIVDVSDAVLILYALFLAELVLPCADAADTDDDARIAINDAIFVLDYLFRGGVAPPPPGPTIAGPDPSDDDLDCARG